MTRKLLITALILLLLSPWGKAADYYSVANGTNINITEHAICRNVDNSIGLSLFVPTKTSTEWSAFYNNPPNLVTISSCVLPVISYSTLSPANSYIDIIFSEGVYTTTGASGALTTSDFQITFTQNGGTATNVTIASITNVLGGTLSAGDDRVRLGLTVTGTPSGVETIEVNPADGTSIYNSADTPVAVTETSGVKLLQAPFSPTTVSLVAGKYSPIGHVDGTAATTMFSRGEGIVSDGTYIYVADTQSFTIRRVTISTGATTTIAGSAWQYGSTDGTGSAARFKRPRGLALNGTDLYVSDGDPYDSGGIGGVIRKIDLTTNAVTLYAGSWSSSGTTNNANPLLATFQYPRDLLIVGTTLYLLDGYNCKIRQINLSTGAVSDFAGSGGCTNTNNANPLLATFSYPNGLTHDGTDFYVWANTKLRKIDGSTGATSTVNSGNIYRMGGHHSAIIGTDLYYGNGGAVEKYDIPGTTKSTFAGTSQYGETDFVNGTGGSARVSFPRGITAVGTDIYIFDGMNPNIRKIDGSQVVTTLVATDQIGKGRNPVDGVGTAAEISEVSALTVDGNFVYFIDNGEETNNQTAVRKMDITSGSVTTVVSNSGELNGWAYEIFVDGDDIMVHTVCAIKNYNTTTTAWTTLAGTYWSCSNTDGGPGVGEIGEVYDIAYDGTYFWTYGNHTIRRIDPSSGSIITVAGDGTQATTDGDGLAAQFNAPSALTVMGNYLYIFEGQHHWAGKRLRRMMLSPPYTVTTIAGGGSGETTDGTGSAASFYTSEDMTNDGTYLYLIQEKYHTIRKIDPSTGVVTTLAGGLRENRDVDGALASSRFSEMSRVHYANGKLWIGSDYNIRKME